MFRKDQHLLLTAPEALELRRQGLPSFTRYALIFASVNRLFSPPILELTPVGYGPEMFRESGANLIQLNAQGRIIQIAFQATREIFSREKFLIPSILEGEVRAFNQEMLERPKFAAKRCFSV